MGNLNDLKYVLGPGARAAKYRVNFSIPPSVPTVSDIREAEVLCKASNFPAMTIGQIEVFLQGRKLVLPGDTTYTNTWELTFYNKEDHALRRDFIAWMKAADHFQNNTHSGNPSSIMGEMSVEQIDSSGNGTALYTFHNVFVQEVGEISLEAESVDTLQEFAVTLSFTDWVVGGGEFNNPSQSTPPALNDISS